MCIPGRVNMKSTKTLRPYQAEKINELLSIYKKNPTDKRAFLQMPVGTGKTFTALSFAIQLLKGKKPTSVIWVVHQTGLADQSANDFKDDFQSLGGTLSQDLTSGHINNISFTFMTWQGLRESISKKARGKYNLLIIDEAHYGSSGSKVATKSTDHSSFKKIFSSKLFDSHLYVSATPWDLNPEVFPKLLVKTDSGHVARKDRIALFTMRDAKKANLISDITFNVFHSANTLALKKLEDESSDMEITGADTAELASEVASRDVDFKHEESKRALRRAVTESTLEGFMRLEAKDGKLPPTIVFCRGIKGDPRSITSAMEILKEKARKVFGNKFKTNKSFVYFCHSQMEENPTDVLNDFKAGKINILCVANMAQEGFNYPGLEVAIDLTPSLDNIRRRIQRIGRIARKKPNGFARYYYADTITNYIVNKGVKYSATEESKDKLENEIRKYDAAGEAEQISEVVANATIAISAINQQDSTNENVEVNTPYFGTDTVELSPAAVSNSNEKLELFDKRKKDIVYCSKVGFVISDAFNGGKVLGRMKSAKLFDMIERDSNQIPWQEIILNEDNIRKIAKWLEA